MTAGRRRQQSRYNELKNYVNSGKYTGHNDALTDAIYNWMFGNAGYKTSGTDWEKYGTPDLNLIFKSRGKHFNRKAAVKDAVSDYQKYYLDELIKNFNNSNNFDPTNAKYVNDLSTGSKDYVGNFLQGYYDDTLSQLDAAKQRGLLTDISYGKGVNYLNDQNSQWSTSLSDDLSSLISDFGKAYDTERGNYEDARDSYIANFNNDFFNMYKGGFGEGSDILLNKTNFDNNYGLDDLYSKFNSNALSSTNSLPFDISEIIANAKIASGINNTQSNELLQAIEDKETQENKKVGLGNQGVF